MGWAVGKQAFWTGFGVTAISLFLLWASKFGSTVVYWVFAQLQSERIPGGLAELPPGFVPVTPEEAAILLESLAAQRKAAVLAGLFALAASVVAGGLVQGAATARRLLAMPGRVNANKVFWVGFGAAGVPLFSMLAYAEVVYCGLQNSCGALEDHAMVLALIVGVSLLSATVVTSVVLGLLYRGELFSAVLQWFRT